MEKNEYGPWIPADPFYEPLYKSFKKYSTKKFKNYCKEVVPRKAAVYANKHRPQAQRKRFEQYIKGFNTTPVNKYYEFSRRRLALSYEARASYPELTYWRLKNAGDNLIIHHTSIDVLRRPYPVSANLNFGLDKTTESRETKPYSESKMGLTPYTFSKWSDTGFRFGRYDRSFLLSLFEIEAGVGEITILLHDIIEGMITREEFLVKADKITDQSAYNALYQGRSSVSEWMFFFIYMAGVKRIFGNIMVQRYADVKFNELFTPVEMRASIEAGKIGKYREKVMGRKSHYYEPTSCIGRHHKRGFDSIIQMIFRADRHQGISDGICATRVPILIKNKLSVKDKRMLYTRAIGKEYAIVKESSGYDYITDDSSDLSAKDKLALLDEELENLREGYFE